MAERDENLSLNHPFGSTVAASKDRQEILLDNNDSKPISNCPPIPTFQDDSFVGGSPNSGLHTQEDANEDTSLVARKSLEFATGVDSDIDIDIDDDDDDDDSSLSSSSSWVEGLTLLEKAEQNRERNALYLRNLNEKYHGQVPTTVKRIDDKLQEEEEADDSDSVKNINVPRGMLMKGSHRILRSLEFDDESETLPDRIQRLYQQYPHRDSQIRRLASLLHSTILQVSGEQTGDSSIYVPAPIFVVGPRGTGKTSVVCDVVETLEKNERRDRASRVASAYINCFTLEPSSIERLVYNAYNQLRPEEYTQLKKLRRKDRRKRKRNLVPTESLSREQEQVAGKADTVKEAIEHSGDQLKDSPDKTKKTDEAIIMVLDDQQADGDKMDSSDRRVQPRRTVKASSENNIAAKSAEPAPPPQGRRARGDTVETSTAAVVAFGRSLQPFYGVGSRRCAFLILDHGERLLSLSARKSKNEKTNFLAEILLLPKVMKLNLTVIIITNHSTLDRTRVNNLVSTGKSLATISNGMHPLVIQFPAYQGDTVFKQILSTKQVLEQIVGSYADETTTKKAFRTKLIEAFLGALVQFISDSTRDLRDFVRLGRTFWPLYIEPLQPNNIKQTLDLVHKKTASSSRPKEDAGQEIVAHLGQKFFKHIGTLSGDTTGISLDSPMIVRSGNEKASPSLQQFDTNQPYLRSCLLLAAFICQNNRPEQDKKVFSSHGNGKRKKRARESHSGGDEGVAFSSSAADVLQLRSLRPRPFQVERVFSIFTTLVNLNPVRSGEATERGDEDDTAESLGSFHLYDDLAQLIDHGHLHPVGFVGSVRGEQVNLNCAKFWCSLTKVKAVKIARKLRIPLETYIVK